MRDPGVEGGAGGRGGRGGQEDGKGEAAGLAGGQRLHEEASRIRPRQLGRRLQGLRAQSRRFAASSQRDVLWQFVLALLFLFLLLVWGTRIRPSSVWVAAPQGPGQRLPSSPTPVHHLPDPGQEHASPTFVRVQGIQRGGQVGELKGKERVRDLAKGCPAHTLSTPPLAPRP